MPGLVDITLPSGEAATVPAEELDQAVAAGARPGTATPNGGGLLGELGTFGLGAGRTASMGFTDPALAEMANIIGGDSLRRDTLKSISLANQANPYSNMAGEFAGMFVGGPSAIGEGVEGAVAGQLGEGLLGKAGAMGLRGATEGALLGQQAAVTEATLGDHDLNGQKVADHVMEGALMGGALGVGLGVGGYGLGSVSQKIKSLRGPIGSAALDDVAGVDGAGQAFRQRAESAQNLVDDLQKSGLTSDQAAKSADEILSMSRAKADAVAGASKDAGFVSGALDDLHGQALARRFGSNPEALEAAQRHYASLTRQILDHDAALDSHALNLKAQTDRVFRMRETLDRLNFTERPEQFAKLMDGSVNYTAARDQVVRLGQMADEKLAFLDSLATKGGGDAAVGRLTKHLRDFKAAVDALPVEGGSAEQARDLYMQAYKMKQAVGKYSGFGKYEHLRTAAENELSDLYKTYQSGLESTDAFGKAGAANAEWNRAFSDGFRRAQDFENRFAVRIDEANGIPVPEASSQKFRDGLLKQVGNAVDREQPLKSTEAYLDWIKTRADAIEKYGDILPSDAAKIADGRAALKDFEGTLGTATKEAEGIARVKQMQLEEQGKGIGGLIGLGADIVQRPMTTIERLAAVRNAVRSTEKAIDGGLRRFFGGKSGDEVLAELKPRPKADVVKDIAEVQSLRANPAALEQRANEMVGDLAQHAPKTAASAKNAFKRAIYHLSDEAPRATMELGILASRKAEPRYTDQGVHEWDAKRRAALRPTTIVADMKHGKLNMDAIRTVQFVSPELYQEIQQSAQDWVLKLQHDGTIDRMPYAQKAVLASLLGVAADATWRPDFLLMMQAAKATPAPQGPQGVGGAAPAMVSKRAIKINTGAWETTAQSIERK